MAQKENIVFAILHGSAAASRSHSAVCLPSAQGRLAMASAGTAPSDFQTPMPISWGANPADISIATPPGLAVTSPEFPSPAAGDPWGAKLRSFARDVVRVTNGLRDKNDETISRMIQVETSQRTLITEAQGVLNQVVQDVGLEFTSQQEAIISPRAGGEQQVVHVRIALENASTEVTDIKAAIENMGTGVSTMKADVATEFAAQMAALEELKGEASQAIAA